LPTIAGDKDQRVVAGVAFLLTLLAMDLIPNGLYAYYPYFIAGALTRRLRDLRAEGLERKPVPEVA
jgi:sulfur transfer protein SufE